MLALWIKNEHYVLISYWLRMNVRGQGVWPWVIQWILQVLCTGVAEFVLSVFKYPTLSHKYTSALNGSQTARERFTNQMLVCVDGTANLYCAICEWFAYRSPWTEICWFFAQTQRELDAQGVLCSPHVCGKLINRAPSTNYSQTVWFACGSLVCTGLNIL